MTGNQPATTAKQPELEYVGFWARVGASLVDSVLALLILVPLLHLVFGRAIDLSGLNLTASSLSASDLARAALSGSGAGASPLAHSEHFLFEWLLPAVAVIAFWMARQATPGKMLIAARIVDARSGGKPSAGQAIARYLGYFVSTIPFGLGLIWVGLDDRKQGWHDKIAGTVVVRGAISGAVPEPRRAAPRSTRAEPHRR
jgi:uncharacterized RDD family membrane protein YckC